MTYDRTATIRFILLKLLHKQRERLDQALVALQEGDSDPSWHQLRGLVKDSFVSWPLKVSQPAWERFLNLLNEVRNA